MADREQVKLLKASVEDWNNWRDKNRTKSIDFSLADFIGEKLNGAKLNDANFSGAYLSNVDLRGADLKNANLIGASLNNAKLNRANLHNATLISANLVGANLRNANLVSADLTSAHIQTADLTNADLTNAQLRGVDLSEANLHKVKLSKANLTKANLSRTILYGADISGANLSNANLVQAVITNANISNCNIYGISVWDLEGEFKEQRELIITPSDKSAITVDNIEIAQFIYLILNNKKIREVLNTLTSKTVLILGRFAIPERKAILDALREKLREYDLLPIVFDFDRPTDKDFTETIKTLAGISYFVIADVTNPKSSPLELQATVPDYQIPFVPIIQEGESPFAMMVDLQKKYPWVLPTRSYDSIETLMSALKPGIIDPAVEMRNQLRLVKAQEQVTESLRDYVDKSL